MSLNPNSLLDSDQLQFKSKFRDSNYYQKLEDQIKSTSIKLKLILIQSHIANSNSPIELIPIQSSPICLNHTIPILNSNTSEFKYNCINTHQSSQFKIYQYHRSHWSLSHPISPLSLSPMVTDQPIPSISRPCPITSINSPATTYSLSPRSLMAGTVQPSHPCPSLFRHAGLPGSLRLQMAQHPRRCPLCSPFPPCTTPAQTPHTPASQPSPRHAEPTPTKHQPEPPTRRRRPSPVSPSSITLCLPA